MFAWVAAGGVVGGVLRSLLLSAWPTPAGEYPVLLLGVNVAGSCLIGLVLAFSEGGRRYRLAPALALALMAGFCGALTTFSTFAIDSVGLFASIGPAFGLLHVFLSVVAWLGAAVLGLLAGRVLNPAAPTGLNPHNRRNRC